MVKIYEVSVEKMDEILNLVKLEQYLAAKLATYNRYQKLQLEELNEIKGIAKRISQFKDKKVWWDNIDPDLKEIIKKYGKI